MSIYPGPVLHKRLIEKYCIPDMGDYSKVGSELSLILYKLEIRQKLTVEDKQWVCSKHMLALFDFIENLEKTGQRDLKILINHSDWIQEKANLAKRNDIRHKDNNTRLPSWNKYDADYIKRGYSSNRRSSIRKDNSTRPALWNKYDIDYIKRSHLSRMNEILKELDQGKKLLRDDALWLSIHDYFCRFHKVRQKFHMNEAISYHESFDKEKDPWQAINASSHYRKANKSQKALDILSKIDMSKARYKRLKSAFSTTKGGCMRDLGRFADAIKLAEEAHSFDPGSFHPCTLLGALHYDIGEYILGDEWFEKAVARGAKTNSVDQEIRSIFMRLNKVEQEKLKQHLLNIDPDRYNWVQDFKPRKKKQ